MPVKGSTVTYKGVSAKVLQVITSKNETSIIIKPLNSPPIILSLADYQKGIS